MTRHMGRNDDWSEIGQMRKTSKQPGVSSDHDERQQGRRTEDSQARES